jgi:cytochrome d ubiquinol oxidase subunit II
VTLLRAHLPEIWLSLIGLLALFYAVSDGANLGVGVLSLLLPDDRERALCVAALKGTWHNSQTWLVLLGGMLFGAFPLFYGVILSALYVPVMAMVFGLILRGLGIELREHAGEGRCWDLAFGVGSLMTAAAQGLALGGLLGGNLAVRDGRFAGGPWAWADPYGLLVAAGVALGYLMLGANFLIRKAAGELQERAYRISWAASLATLAVSLVVHAWTALRFAHVGAKWIDSSALPIVAPFPALAALAFALGLRSVRNRRELAPLLWNAATVALSFAGLSVGFYPHMIPGIASSPVTVRAAAASPDTLLFMLLVVSILLPLILGYTAYERWVFRGKVSEGGYESD